MRSGHVGVLLSTVCTSSSFWLGGVVGKKTASSAQDSPCFCPERWRRYLRSDRWHTVTITADCQDRTVGHLARVGARKHERTVGASTFTNLLVPCPNHNYSITCLKVASKQYLLVTWAPVSQLVLQTLYQPYRVPSSSECRASGPHLFGWDPGHREGHQHWLGSWRSQDWELMRISKESLVKSRSPFEGPQGVAIS